MPQTFPFEALAVHKFTAAFPDELSFEEGALLRVLLQHEDGWWEGHVISNEEPIRVGLFPGSYVKKTVSTAPSSRPPVPPKPFVTAAKPNVFPYQQPQYQKGVRFAPEDQLIEVTSPGYSSSTASTPSTPLAPVPSAPPAPSSSSSSDFPSSSSSSSSSYPSIPSVPEKPTRDDSAPKKLVYPPPGVKPQRSDLPEALLRKTNSVPSFHPASLPLLPPPLVAAKKPPVVSAKPARPNLRVNIGALPEAPTSTEASSSSSTSSGSSVSQVLSGAKRQELEERIKDLEEQVRQLGSGSLMIPEEEVIQGTANFDFSLQLGEDRLGEIFKGKLGGRQVLVKRLSLGSNPNLLAAVKAMAIYRHPNLLTLLSHTPLISSRPCLVYEYLPQGTLRSKLDTHDPGCALPYDLRIKISWEISGALAFLNKPYSQANPVSHQDISSNDIYLGPNFQAKIANFSFAVTPNSTPARTTETAKTDIFSFGILMAELLTAKRPTKLAELILTAMPTRGTPFPSRELLDPLMKDSWVPDSYSVFAQLMRECLEVDPLERPTMRELNDRLKRLGDMRAASCLLCGSKAGNVKLSCGHVVVCHQCTTETGKRQGCLVCGTPVLEAQRRMSRMVLIP